MPVAKLPNIAAVEGLSKYRLGVRWAGGPRADSRDVIDVSPMVFSFRIYKPLRTNPKLWQSVSVAHFGNAVSWNGGIEMSADSIDRFACETMDSAEFSAFLDRCYLTQEAAAHALGRSRRQIASYVGGTAIPRVVALACLAYEDRHTVKNEPQAVKVTSTSGTFYKASDPKMMMRPFTRGNVIQLPAKAA